MAKFVNDNSGIFEQLGRFFKRKWKDKAKSSKRLPDHSPLKSSEKRSVTKQSRRKPYDQYEKHSSKVWAFPRY